MSGQVTLCKRLKYDTTSDRHINTVMFLRLHHVTSVLLDVAEVSTQAVTSNNKYFIMVLKIQLSTISINDKIL